MAGFFERWKNNVVRSRFMKRLTILSRKIILPGFSGLSLYQVLQFTWTGIRRGRITNRAAAVSFRILLAVPPLFIVLLTIIPFIPIENFQENLFGYLAKTMPSNAFSLVDQTLNDLITKKQQTVLSISFLLALFYSSNAIQAIIDGFSRSYNIVKPHSILIQYARSFALMLVFSFAMILGVALITFSGPILSYLQALNIIGGDLIVLLIEILKWILVIIIFEIGISVLYRSAHSGRWRALNAGAAFATLGFLIVSSLFAWYVNNFGNYNKLYGSVGTVLVVMLWLYFNSIVLLIGFEINAGIERAKEQDITKIEPEDIIK